MRIAIDIDGTITNSPAFFARFIENQLLAGNEIHILTGGIALPEEDIESPPHRIRQLKSYGIGSYTRLVQVTRGSQYPDIGAGKGEYCRKNKIDMILEDDVLYVKEISRISPDTQAFLIV
jgi:hypothetical protein